MTLDRTTTLLVGGVTTLLLHATAARADIALNVFTNPHPVVSGGTIGFAYAGDKFVGSVQADGLGVLYQTDLSGGNVQLFAPTVSIPGGSPSAEHFVAASLGKGGFPSRDVYVAAADGIVHITNDGSSSDTFVAGLSGAVRGILFDAIGTYGNDMLVTTNSGNVYRIDSAGTPSLLAAVGEDTEGLDIAPLGAQFGAFDGQVIVASEGSGLLRAIATDGTVNVINPSIPVPSAEELTFVPLDLGASGNPVEGFYGSDYPPDVVKADVAEFVSMNGDAIVTGETTHTVHRVHWNGSAFEITQIGMFPNQPEDGIFVTVAIIGTTTTTSSSTTTTTTPPCGPAERARIEAECNCDGAANHGGYVRCAAHLAKDAVKAGTLSRSEAHLVKRCAARSTCGKRGFVACCRTNAKGVERCSIKHGAAKCKAPKRGSARVGSRPSCCDACAGGCVE